MSTFTIAGMALAIVLIMIAAWQLVPQDDQSARLGDRLASVEDTVGASPEELALRAPFSERIILPALNALGGVFAKRTKQGQLQTLRQQIRQAGSSQRPETLLALRVIAPIVLGAVGFGFSAWRSLAPPISLLPVVGGLVLGYMYPTSSLKGKIKKRREEIQLALPDTLDLLSVCLEAGSSLDVAMARVCEMQESVLAQEFQSVLTEIKLGRPRDEALLAMAERNNVDELSSFLRAIVQAEPLGVPITNILTIQSEELRRMRRQRAEEKGHRAPVLMLLPMMGCIFPCIFVILLGPAVLKVLVH